TGRELRTAGRPVRADNSSRRARHRATDGADQRHGENRLGAGGSATRAGSAIHRDRGRIAYNIVVATVHLGKNLRHTTIEVRGGNSSRGHLNDLWIVRLPIHLISDVYRFRWVNVRAKCFELKIQGRINRAKRASRRLDRDPGELRTASATGGIEQRRSYTHQKQSAKPLPVHEQLLGSKAVIMRFRRGNGSI